MRRILLKLFLPSWNFFNDFVQGVVLEIRVTCRGEVMQPWRTLFPSPRTTGWRRVLWNPVGNLELLEQAEVERAVGQWDAVGADGPPWSWAGGRVTYVRLSRIGRARIRRLDAAWDKDTSALTFQWRLRQATEAGAETVLYCSPEIPVAEQEGDDDE